MQHHVRRAAALALLLVAGQAISATISVDILADEDNGNPAGGPIAYLDNLAFQIKMLVILIAGLNLAAYYFTGIARAAANVPAGSDAAPAAKVVAVVSLLAWFGVIYFGRMIMYNDTLLYAFGK